MSNLIRTAQGPANLRQQAAKKLSIGSPTAGQRASQTEALAVLHQMASSPNTAADALALLHELQVHQVELDLQQEELERSRLELESALMRQTALFERAPVGYMTIQASTVLCEINLAGARLLGVARHELLGRRLTDWLAPASGNALQALLGRTQMGGPAQGCELQLTPMEGLNRTVQAVADRDTTPERFLLVLMGSGIDPGMDPKIGPVIGPLIAQ